MPFKQTNKWLFKYLFAWLVNWPFVFLNPCIGHVQDYTMNGPRSQCLGYSVDIVSWSSIISLLQVCCLTIMWQVSSNSWIILHLPLMFVLEIIFWRFLVKNNKQKSLSFLFAVQPVFSKQTSRMNAILFNTLHVELFSSLPEFRQRSTLASFYKALCWVDQNQN